MCFVFFSDRSVLVSRCCVCYVLFCYMCVFGCLCLFCFVLGSVLVVCLPWSTLRTLPDIT